MIIFSAHQLAKKLLELPDLPVHIDGIGEDVSLAYPPEIGKIRNQEIVILEITTHKRYYQEQQMKDRVEGKISPKSEKEL